MLRTAQNHGEGWRKEIGVKLLGKMPQSTWQTWPQELTTTLPKLVLAGAASPWGPLPAAAVSQTSCFGH